MDPTPLAPGEPRTQINLWDVGATLFGLAHRDLDFSWSESFSAGAPTFVARGQTVHTRGVDVNGYVTGGVIVRSGVTSGPVGAVLAHERLHVLQHDFTAQTWSDPLEDALLPKIFGSGLPWERVVLGIAQPLASGLLLMVSDPSILTRWFESEAEFLSER